MRIINLTQHVATSEQLDQGVFEPQNKEAVKRYLTFNSLPSAGEVRTRAVMLAQIASDEGADAAMIGGAPYLMGPLEEALWLESVEPLYSFSVRESKETINEDGSVTKAMVFRHRGFVEA